MREFIATLASLNILLIEDSKTDAILLKKTLAETIPNLNPVHRCENLEAALQLLGEKSFDVVLLDLTLPDTSGFNGLLHIQNMAPSLPIIIITSHADEDLALEAVGHGAQDYLFKDKTNGHAMKRAIQYAMQRKQFEGILISQANFDPLTGLANRLLFESRLDMTIARSKRSSEGFAVFFLDLDHFKSVNDTVGHAAGDHVLRQVAERLKATLRGNDTPARFGGDEFALIIEGVKHAEDCRIVAGKIIAQLDQPISLNHKTLLIGVSIGIAPCFSEKTVTREGLMQRADAAMYRAKQAPHSDYQFNADQLQDSVI